VTTRDVGGRVASLLDQKMYLTRREAEEAAKMGIPPEEAFRRIQAQMYSDRKVTRAWLRARGITPQQALEAYQVYAHERAANTRRKDGTPGRVDPESLRRSVLRLAGELQQSE
jgi:chromatin segregation and condensation protein Rec8/ScpA/Scc1 (kleisin family)